MPSENGVRSDDRADLIQRLASDGLAEHGELPSLIVIESRTLATELIAKGLVLRLEILDHSLLVLV